MYCVPVKTVDRGRLTEEEIASQLSFILGDAPCLPTKPAPVGLLTAEPRSIWARDRQVLLQNEQNQQNIELIEQALVLICLDESLPVSFNRVGFSGATDSLHFCDARVSFFDSFIFLLIPFFKESLSSRMKLTWRMRWFMVAVPIAIHPIVGLTRRCRSGKIN